MALGTASATDQKSIAVLPFVSMSADKADEYLSDGMTEELLNMLAQVPGLRVPGRSSIFAFFPCSQVAWVKFSLAAAGRAG